MQEEVQMELSDLVLASSEQVDSHARKTKLSQSTSADIHLIWDSHSVQDLLALESKRSARKTQEKVQETR